MTTALSLSRRELQIVDLVCQELSDKEIATELRISPATVSNHLSRIAEKLGLRNIGEPRRRGIRRWLARNNGQVSEQ